MARLLSVKEAKQVAVIQALLAGQLSSAEACEHLGCDRTTLWRRKKRFLEGGPESLAHGLRGGRGNRRGERVVRDAVCELYRREYKPYGFGARHFWEVAQEQFPRPVPYSTVWRWLREKKLTERSRRPSKHRKRRPRKEAFGELIQMDTSVHDWFGTGEKQYLISAIDDATGLVVGCFFHTRDTVLGNMRVLKDIFERWGLPIALYVDRSPIFKFTRTGYGKAYRHRSWGPVRTQVEQALDTLGIELIHAFTPQAKGRIERMFGTWQSRLVPELAKAGIRDFEAANEYVWSEYLPRFNERFAESPQPRLNAFAPLFDCDLNRILAERYPRVVANDHVVSCAPAQLKAKILPSQPRVSYAKTRVEVLRHIDGSCSIYRGDEKLRFEVIN